MITTKTHTYSAPAFSLNSALCRVQRALDIRRERKQLLDMDANMLKDIGISYEDARREATRGFWDID